MPPDTRAPVVADGAAMRAARIEIDFCPIRFETDCTPALQSMGSLLSNVFSGRYFQHALAPIDPAEKLPTLRYLDRSAYASDYDSDRDVCVFEAPWAEVGRSTLLAMWLHVLSELVRQRRSEYLLHASAVALDGKAIVLLGGGEAGKTIGALELCMRHGFELFANNRVKLGAADGRIRLLRGDPLFRLRYSSVLKYDPALARTIFPEAAGGEPAWHRKCDVTPSQLGIGTPARLPRLAVFVLLKLESDGSENVVRRIRADSLTHDAFVAMSDISREICHLLRGTSFVPLVNGSGFRDVFVPCLDTPELTRRRVDFLRTLFAGTHVLTVRAGLRPAIEAILQGFHDPPPG